MAGRSFLTVAALLGVMLATMPLSIDPTLPGMPLIAEGFGVSNARVQLSLSAFVVGIAVGQLFYGPLSDRFGRRPVLVASLSLFVVTVLGCALAASIEAFTVFRCLQGLGACGATVLSRAIVRDLFDREDAARVFSYTMMVHGIAPIVGPIIGAQLTIGLGWRSVYWALVIYGAVALAVAWRAFAETAPGRNRAALSPAGFVRNYRRLLASRVFAGYMLAMAFCFCGLFAFLSASAPVMIDGLGVTVADYGYYYSATMVAYMLGNFIGARLVGRLTIERMIVPGTVAIAAAGSLMAALGIARVDSPLAIAGPMFAYMLAFCFIVPPAQAAALSLFPGNAGAAASMLGFVQLALSALTGALVGDLADGTQVPMTAAVGVVSFGPMAAYGLMVRRRRRLAG